MTELKILFINFQSGMCMSEGYSQYFTKGWKYIFPHNSDSLSDVIEFIKKEKPDIVTFAEIDGASWRSKNIDQVKSISEQTNLKYNHFFLTRSVNNWINQGNAIISKYPVYAENQGTIQLPTMESALAKRSQYKDMTIEQNLYAKGEDMTFVEQLKQSRELGKLETEISEIQGSWFSKGYMTEDEQTRLNELNIEQQSKEFKSDEFKNKVSNSFFSSIYF